MPRIGAKLKPLSVEHYYCDFSFTVGKYDIQGNYTVVMPSVFQNTCMWLFSSVVDCRWSALHGKVGQVGSYKT